MAKKATGPRNKARGYEFEVELKKSAEAVGLDTVRAWGSNGRAIGEKADVDLVVDSKRVQAKRRRKLPQYLRIPDSCDAVAFRQDRGPRMVLIRWSDWLEMLDALKRGRDRRTTFGGSLAELLGGEEPE